MLKIHNSVEVSKGGNDPLNSLRSQLEHLPVVLNTNVTWMWETERNIIRLCGLILNIQDVLVPLFVCVLCEGSPASIKVT